MGPRSAGTAPAGRVEAVAGGLRHQRVTRRIGRPAAAREGVAAEPGAARRSASLPGAGRGIDGGAHQRRFRPGKFGPRSGRGRLRRRACGNPAAPRTARRATSPTRRDARTLRDGGGEALADEPRRHAAHDRVRGDVARHHRAGPDHGAVAHRDARQHGGAMADPHVVADRDGLRAPPGEELRLVRRASK